MKVLRETKLEVHPKYDQINVEQIIVDELSVGDTVTVILKDPLGAEVLTRTYTVQYGKNTHCNISFQDKGDLK